MPDQLSPNIIRIIGGIYTLNKIHGTDLGLDELKFCYSLSKGANGYSLSARSIAHSLVYALPNSHKGVFDDVIIMTCDIEPDPINRVSY